jgi:GNAT superfamily N-acetyltransferase
MSSAEIVVFGPDDRAAVRSARELLDAVSAHDSPWDPPEPVEHYAAALRHGWDGEPATPYLMTVEDTPVGVGSVALTQRDNLHLAWLGVTVHPDHRRRGHGRRLFDRMVEEARAAGRTSVGLDGWDSERAVGFAAAVGLERRSQAVKRRQHVAQLAPERLQELYDGARAAAADYELVRIAGRTPPELVGPVAELMAAINDAPTDDLDMEDEAFSPERLAAYETATLRRRNRLYRLVARHRDSGELGGHTVVAVDQDRPALAHQHDTAVARAHRGHRLGLLLKADMLRWLAEAEPQVETVDTWNTESNEHMIGVNEALGYRVVARELQFQRSV